MDRSLKEAKNVGDCGKSFEIKTLKMHVLVLFIDEAYHHPVKILFRKQSHAHKNFVRRLTRWQKV